MIYSKHFQKLLGIEGLESPIFITVCNPDVISGAAYGTNNPQTFNPKWLYFYIKYCLSRRISGLSDRIRIVITNRKLLHSALPHDSIVWYYLSRERIRVIARLWKFRLFEAIRYFLSDSNEIDFLFILAKKL